MLFIKAFIKLFLFILALLVFSLLLYDDCTHSILYESTFYEKEVWYGLGILVMPASIILYLFGSCGWLCVGILCVAVVIFEKYLDGKIALNKLTDTYLGLLLLLMVAPILAWFYQIEWYNQLSPGGLLGIGMGNLLFYYKELLPITLLMWGTLLISLMLLFPLDHLFFRLFLRVSLILRVNTICSFFSMLLCYRVLEADSQNSGDFEQIIVKLYHIGNEKAVESENKE
ncbi:MAG TPA: hypothetical protein VHA52_01160 [Candidatus Babeliaceae bacterium]|nr:hypothetical protein [Candidatus Babeliaceae bacterium]